MLESRSGWIGEMIVWPLCRGRCCYRGLRYNCLCVFLEVQSLPIRQFFACQDICRAYSDFILYSA